MTFWRTKNSADDVEVDFVAGEGSLFKAVVSQQDGSRWLNISGAPNSGICSS